MIDLVSENLHKIIINIQSGHHNLDMVSVERTWGNNRQRITLLRVFVIFYVEGHFHAIQTDSMDHWVNLQ